MENPWKSNEYRWIQMIFSGTRIVGNHRKPPIWWGLVVLNFLRPAGALMSLRQTLGLQSNKGEGNPIAYSMTNENFDPLISKFSEPTAAVNSEQLRCGLIRSYSWWKRSWWARMPQKPSWVRHFGITVPGLSVPPGTVCGHSQSNGGNLLMSAPDWRNGSVLCQVFWK